MKIDFINHACFSIEEDNEMLMFDPWFFGKVFNNSWSLLEETEIHDLNLDSLKYIAISHEHPDHLHWPTLKKIREVCNHDISVIVPKRNNKNVVNEIVKLGFKCAEMPPNRQFNVGKFKITNFPTGHDSAYVVKCANKTILNQNDCKLSAEQVFQIIRNYDKIDYHFIQFSLAGYYSNKDDHKALLEARSGHVDMIDHYKNRFRPRVTIPFASYVYFCREENSFLNDYVVNLGDLDPSYQLLAPGDEILEHNYSNRNIKNIETWNKNISNIEIFKSTQVTKEDILSVAKKFLSTIPNVGLKKSIFSFYDIDSNLVIDYPKNKVYFSKHSCASIAKVCSCDMYSFFKFPWGADTMNITSCFEVYNKNLWRQNLIFKDEIYER